MELKSQIIRPKKLNMDFSEPNQNTDGSMFINALNIRITPNNDNTLYSITPEKGSINVSDAIGNDIYVDANYLGSVIIDNRIIAFFDMDGDNSIYEIDIDSNDSTKCTIKQLYSGSLNMHYGTCNLELSYIIERSNIIKLYWIDGVNQPRVARLDYDTDGMFKIIYSGNDDDFNFLKNINGNESISITKIDSGNGSFPCGIIKYYIAYYNKFGGETKPIYISPIYYTTLNSPNRGGTNSTSENSFNIKIANVNTRFEYIRIYSLIETSDSATPLCKIVGDYAIDTINGGTLDIIDNNEGVEEEDYKVLPYLGGEYIVPKTMTFKDTKVFFGNIKQRNLDDKFNSNIKLKVSSRYSNQEFIGVDDGGSTEYYYGLKNYFSADKGYGRKLSNQENSNSIYNYDNNHQIHNNSRHIKGFKGGEMYRLGYQLVHKDGSTSNVIWIGDYENKLYPTEIQDNNISYGMQAIISVVFDYDNIDDLKSEIKRLNNLGYNKIRPVIVYPNINDRNVICQGILNPTIFNIKERKNNICSNMSSWFFRPSGNVDFDNEFEYGCNVEYRHGYALPNTNKPNAEIQSAQYAPYAIDSGRKDVNDNSVVFYDSSQQLDSKYTKDIFGDDGEYSNIMSNTTLERFVENLYYVDRNVVTLNSPDIDFQGVVSIGDNVGLRIIGAMPICSSHSKMSINASSGTLMRFSDSLYIKNYWFDYGNEDYAINNTFFGSKMWCSLYRYMDGDAYIINDEDNKDTNRPSIAYPIYPFHRNGSLNNYSLKYDNVDASAKIQQKILGTFRFSYNTSYLRESNTTLFDISDADIFYTANDTSIHMLDGDCKYFGTVNKPAMLSTLGLNRNVSYFIASDYNKKNNQIDYSLYNQYKEPKFVQVYTKKGNDVVALNTASNDMCKLTYKSSNHAVLKLANDSYIANKLSSYDSQYGYMIIGELYHKTIENRFGGSTEYDLYNNNWVVAGDDISLSLDDVSKSDSLIYKLGIDGIYANVSQSSMTRDIDISDYDSDDEGNYSSLSVTALYKSSEESVAVKKTTVISWSNVNKSDDGTKTYLYINNGAWVSVSSIPETITDYIIVDFTNKSCSSTTSNITNISLFIGVKDHSLYVPFDKFTMRKEKLFSAIYIYAVTSDGTKYELTKNTTDYKLTYDDADGVHIDISVADSMLGTKFTINNAYKEISSTSKSMAKLSMDYTEGDTFYQRYDCLKTVPYNTDDVNQIVEVMSGMIETRINLDARIDVCRGDSMILSLLEDSYKINTIYNSNLELTYQRTKNPHDSGTNKYESAFTWSLNKSTGAEIDAWQNVNLGSIYDCDNNLGPINKIVNFNDNLIVFQDRGMSLIKYNENVAIPTNVGVPIEMANSASVSGVQYISKMIGCKDKETICITPNALYFVDRLNNAIYQYGNTLTKLSEKGFVHYTKDILLKSTDIKTRYDAETSDVYFMHGDKALAFSERMNEFTSFYSYKCSDIINVNGETFAFNYLKSINNKYYEHLFKLRYNPTSGSYTDNLVGVSAISEFAFICNGSEYVNADKVFDRMEYYRSIKSSTPPISPIIGINVTDTYQNTGWITGSNYDDIVENKFGIHRVSFPRDASNGRDRLKDTWCKIDVTIRRVLDSRIDNMGVYFYV